MQFGYGMYSSSGIDILNILAQIGNRPNPQIDIGPVDMSSTFTLCDVSKEDCPVIYASESFEALSGYSQSEILGKNMRFMQAPGGVVRKGEVRKFTDQTCVAKLSRKIFAREEYQTIIVNYKKSGEQFANLLSIIPIRNQHDGSVMYILGLQIDVICQADAGLKRLTDGTYSINYNDVSILQTGQSTVSRAHALSLFESNGNVVPSLAKNMLSQKKIVPVATYCYCETRSSCSIEAYNGVQIHYNPIHNGPLCVIKRPGNLKVAEVLSSYNIIDNIGCFVHIISNRGIILYASSKFSEQYLEYNAGEIVGRNISKFLNPSDSINLLRVMKKVQNGESFSFAYSFNRKRSGSVLLEVIGHRYELHNQKNTKCFILSGFNLPIINSISSHVFDSIDHLLVRKSDLSLPSAEFWAKISSTGLVLYVFPFSVPIFGIPLDSMKAKLLFSFFIPGTKEFITSRMSDLTKQDFFDFAIQKKRRLNFADDTGISSPISNFNSSSSEDLSHSSLKIHILHSDESYIPAVISIHAQKHTNCKDHDTNNSDEPSFNLDDEFVFFVRITVDSLTASEKKMFETVDETYPDSQNGITKIEIDAMKAANESLQAAIRDLTKFD